MLQVRRHEAARRHRENGQCAEQCGGLRARRRLGGKPAKLPRFLASSRVECLEDDSGCGVGSASTSVRLRAHEGFLSQPPGPELAFAGIEGGEGAEDVEGSSCSVAKIAAVKSPPAIGGDDEAVGPETGKDSDDAVSGDSESVGGVIDSDRGLVAHGRVDAAGKVSEAKTGEEVVSEVG